MRIAIGADHRGAESLDRVAAHLEKMGHQVSILGEPCEGRCDYPDKAYLVATAVAGGEADRGLLLCGSGIGMCMAANKVKGIRAALASDELTAEMSRSHNDANVLCLSADLLGQRLIEKIADRWLSTEFEGGRHARRVEKIRAIEEGRDPQTVKEAGAGASGA